MGQARTIQARTILIAGAGIGGLTAALALARIGFSVTICEQAEVLGDAGAGIQLSPNATRILNTLGVGQRLKDVAVVPDGVSIRQARSGDEIIFMTLGQAVQYRYGAPYWSVHRGDLQAALLASIADEPAITLKLGTTIEDFSSHPGGVTAKLRNAQGVGEETTDALIGADGLWSTTRAQFGDASKPRFRDRTAWRAMVPTAELPPAFQRRVTFLWLGRNAHLVHYPVRGGTLVNIVAIVRDRWREPGWSAPGDRDELLRRYAASDWAPEARALIQQPVSWSKWALFDRQDNGFAGQGPVTLLGDAAHPMLPFLAQGAAMAIEDAAVLARCLDAPDVTPTAAMRRYESLRRDRVGRVQAAARANGRTYHMSGPPVLARNMAMSWLGGERLRTRYDWLYDWRAE